MNQIANRAVSSANVRHEGNTRGPASKANERIEAIAAAMQQHGPLSVPRLVALTGWSRQTIATQLVKSTDRFEKISEHCFSVGGSIPATYYLAGKLTGEDEEALDRIEDERCRSFEGWPKADDLVISTINAMIKSGAQAWQQ